MAGTKNDRTAQYWTGILYSTDGTTFKSMDKAKEWYEKSAKQGYVAAINNLAYILHNEKTSASQKQAFAWWKEGTNRGSSISQL